MQLPKSPIIAKDNSVSSPTAGRVLNAKMPWRGGEGSIMITNRAICDATNRNARGSVEITTQSEAVSHNSMIM